MLLRAAKFYWLAARGYRLRPWRSPYVRWRMETFAGAEASPWGIKTLFQLVWKYRRNLSQFLAWVEREERRRLARERDTLPSVL